MQKVTTEQVNAMMMDIFFKNPRRVNLKIYSQTHAADNAKRAES